MNAGNDKISKTLKFSLLDGIFASIMVGFTQDYFSPFLLLFDASARQIGFLTAFPNLFSSLIQFKSADLTEKFKSRKKIITNFVFLQAITLLPMAFIGFLKGINLYFFIILVTLFTSFGAVVNAPWGSLMSDLVEVNKRGEYFGWRSKTMGFVTIVATCMAGVLLHKMEKINIYYGFLIIFCSAFICRIISWFFLDRMYEPHLEHKEESYFTIFDFLSRIKESNFAKFVLFVSMMNFSVYVASPFFAVFMLKDLSFNYFIYTIIMMATPLVSILTFSRWGKHADKVGNLKIIKFTAPLIGIIPLLWLINRHPIFLIFIQCFGGFVWAGFNLCASNFIYDAVSPEKRIRCISYFNAFNGLSICLGALSGGIMLKYLPSIFGYKMLTLFLISSFLRCIVAFWLPRKLKEVRHVEKINSNQLFFSVIGMRQIFE